MTIGGNLAGGRVGPFHLEQLLGEGGQGTVWKATDVRNGQLVALKVIRTSLAGPSEVARLRREAALLKSFEHPGLPRGFDLFEDEASGVISLAMEYVEAKPLHALLAEGALAPREVAKLGLCISRVLTVIHAQGIAHRDIKPSNILVRPTWAGMAPGGVVIVDFGIARGQHKHATTQTAAGGAVGTLSYLAPERLMARPNQAVEAATPALDVYALGVLLWSMLTGHHPTGLTMTASVSELVMAYAQPRHPVIAAGTAAAIDGSLPGLLPLLARCVSPRPHDRPTSGAIAGELEAILSRDRATAVQPAPSWTTNLPPVDAGTAFVPPMRTPDPSRGQPTDFVPHQRPRSYSTALTIAAVLAATCVIAAVKAIPDPEPRKSRDQPPPSGGDLKRGGSDVGGDPQGVTLPPKSTPRRQECYSTKWFGVQCVDQPCRGGLHEVWNCDVASAVRVRCQGGVVAVDRCDKECLTIPGGMKGTDDMCR